MNSLNLDKECLEAARKQFCLDIGLPWEEYEKNREKQEYCNSAFMFDKYGNFRGYYGKNHLVPFAESLPFREYPVIG